MLPEKETLLDMTASGESTCKPNGDCRHEESIVVVAGGCGECKGGPGMLSREGM